MFSELVLKTRTIRRFDRSKSVTDTDLTNIIECASSVASAGNLQRLRYVTLTGASAEEAFSMVSLGGLLPENKKPTVDVAPTAYIVLTSAFESPDQNLLIDVGISAEAIVLAARERGIGSCMIRNFNREHFASLMTEQYQFPLLVIALGYPAEDAKIVRVCERESLKYYKDENEVNVVPKMTSDSLTVAKRQ